MLENSNTPLSVFAAVAQSQGINCWFQGRTLDSNGDPLSNAFITVEQQLNRNGGSLLVRFGTNTRSLTTGSPVNNAICLPVDCEPPISAFISARLDFEATSTALVPQPFPADTFDITENAPILFGDFFSFEEVITATTERPRPFYTSLSNCQLTGSEPSPSSSSFFEFQEIDVTDPLPTDSCFVKVQILDCFLNNQVRITSINPASGIIDSDLTVIVEEPPNIEMPTGSGTFPPEITTMGGNAGVCDETTATLRAACLPFVCGDNAIVTVFPNAESGQTDSCTITGRSVLLSNSLLSDTEINDQLIMRSTLLSSNDFNNPDLGLYFEGNALNSALMAEQMCFDGTGDGNIATDIDVTTGAAVEFSCF